MMALHCKENIFELFLKYAVYKREICEHALENLENSYVLNNLFPHGV